jgi:hypothetical protein
VQRLRSGNELDVGDPRAVRIEQQLEDLLHSGLTPASTEPMARPASDSIFRAPTIVERRSTVQARSRRVPRTVRVSEEALGRFLDAVAAALCSSESLSGSSRTKEGIRAALRAILLSRVEVAPESPITNRTISFLAAVLLEDRPRRAPRPRWELEHRARHVRRLPTTDSTSTEPVDRCWRAVPARPPAC